MITTDITIAKNALQEGQLIALPTETVYGLAGNAYKEEVVKKIFELKKRPLFNPLIVHIKSADFLTEVAQDIPESAFKLAKAFWPGPLTMVLKKKTHISDTVTAGKDTVAVRVPNHPIALQLLDQLDFPLAAPSANPFGSISPTTATHVDHYFSKDLAVILDGGNCQKGIESTIVGFSNDEPILYRLGSLSVEQIEEKIGPIKQLTKNKDNNPVAPGMLLRHYAPNTPTYLTVDVDELLKTFSNRKVGILSFQKTVLNIPVTQQEILSPTGDFEEAAKNLYAAMHRLDRLGLDLIIAEKLPDIGLGRTINDKLQRATEKE
ncbi:L-threonylcarbamoyladenylate synthase [Aquimarina brevivitae]|uniref:Threonylcarbamoyl-AMP synthase n=1 Tax=Aquimarina brevivitae TaxID=323412 RepID=A0A4Q7PGJ7_9FLAO|nr:L-threonylcarbamoyladenylate synthase [Aquimarina brevivitae]RZS99621.1 translation factor SUA5 [Aquimarina brevivitae]